MKKYLQLILVILFPYLNFFALICLFTGRFMDTVFHSNVVIKLIHIPAYVLLFIVGLLCLITIFTTPITIVLILLDGMTIFLTGLIGLGGVIRSSKENRISKSAMVIHGILQFIFCADVISVVVIYRTVRLAVRHDNVNNSIKQVT